MEAADKLDFERAAYLRDIRDNLVKVLNPPGGSEKELLIFPAPFIRKKT